MARKQAGEKTGSGWRAGMRYAAFSSIGFVAVVASAVAFHRVDRFLASDPRFRLTASTESDEENGKLRIEGVVHASRARIVDTFSGDFGRSIYLAPLKERRRALVGIDWVRDASVARAWPDRLEVRVQEREPVAFIQYPSVGGAFRTALIDADGVILEPPAKARFALPVVTGVRPDESQDKRRRRVDAALRLLRSLGGMAEQVSEIDAANPSDLRVVQQIDGRAVVLILGNSNFLPRLQNFLSHYPEIRKRLPNAVTFDLRLDDRITATEEGNTRG